MTDWQTTGTHVPSFAQQQQQAMELSRIITQLAAANQQLSAAHNTTLGQMDILYSELRQSRTRRSSRLNPDDDSLRRRLINEDVEDDEEDRKRTEARIFRLETILLEKHCCCRNRTKCLLRHEKEDKLRYRLERLENLLNIKEVNENVDLDRNLCGITLSRVSVPEDEVENKDTKSLTDLQGEPNTIYTVRGSDFRCNQITTSLCTNMHLGKESRVDDEVLEENSDGDQRLRNDDMGSLLTEVERLKNDRRDFQERNEMLLKNLMDEKITVQQLREDYQVSMSRYEDVKRNLCDQKKEYDQLSKNFNLLRNEKEELKKELETFHLGKNTAQARISSLEEDLRQSLHEKEQIRNTEAEKISILEGQLSEEVEEKKKQVVALDNALCEIQRLKETIKTEKKDNTRLDEDIVDSIDSTSTTKDDSTSSRLTVEEFRKDLTLKREARQRAIAAVSSEMERLREELEAEKVAHSETSRLLELFKSERASPQKSNSSGTGAEKGLKSSRTVDQNLDTKEETTNRLEAEKLTNILKVSDELRNDVRFQIEKVDDLRYQLESEPDQHRYRIRSLTEITNRTRESLIARERQTNKLKDHLAQILVRLGDRTFLENKDIGAECERQLENINALKSLYNERLKVVTELKDAATKELVDVKERLEHSLKKSENLEEDLKKAEEKIDSQDTEITNLESQLGLTKADCRDLQNQMSLINSLFTQMLLGASSADMNLDRLTQLLQENHDLISEMAREEGTEAAALPKLLLDLVEQVEGNKEDQKRIETNAEGTCDLEKKEDDLQGENIAHNLPKVWRILLELLSCHAVGSSTSTVTSTSDPNSCYKSVDTPAGPRLVISVSKTYIRLKELILEKKHLEKEMTRMKQLNTHLESKLSEQENRLSMVSAELSKTWNIVGRMQAQHQQLHTHEKILRYELQQKRKMLQELKQELEYCREKWESARQKNTNTEIEWRSLRREFAARKALAAHDSFNNSGESGFSDERGDDTDEEDDVDDEIIIHGPRRRSRKEGPRTPTPDTESEQPTDTESSEWKTCPMNLEQRTPTPETDTDLEKIEEVKDNNIAIFDAVGEQLEEDLNPLDQALTNVIENLIGINDEKIPRTDLLEPLQGLPANDLEHDTVTIEDKCSRTKEENNLPTEDKNVSLVKVPGPSKDTDMEEVTLKEEEEEVAGEKRSISGEESSSSPVIQVPIKPCRDTTRTMSVFSIGPFTPNQINTRLNDQLVPGSSNHFSAPVFGDSSANALKTCELEDTTLANATAESLGQEDKNLDSKKSSRLMDSVPECDSVSLDSSSSVETVKEFPVAEVLPGPSTSSNSVETKSKVTSTRTPEEVLASRADRLKRLEEQADWLMKKMNATSRRGSALSSRLEELHEVYKEPPAPPPMPDVLPSRRLRSSLQDSRNQETQSPTTENSNKDVNESPPGNVP